MAGPYIPSLLLVMAGGAAGAGARFALGRWALAAFGPALPWGTFLANVSGGLAMGLLAGWLARAGIAPGASETWRLLLGMGLLGGFTTFSAFSLELALMIERGAPALALGYALASVAIALLALFAGLAIARNLSGGALA